MIKAILVDDEKNALEMMEWLLRTYAPDVAILASCLSAREGLDAIAQGAPDVLFLDIEMPRMNGFDMLAQLDKPRFDIVFCTAYDRFAIRAFRFAALDYLLKPIDPHDLQLTLHRIREKRPLATTEQFSLLLQQVRSQQKLTPARFALTTADGLLFVPTADILYCVAESNYTLVVFVAGRKILVSRTLGNIDETLSGDTFFRVHSSYLINIDHIRKFVRADGGYLIMEDDTQIPLARSRRQEFMERFPKF
jgi:two-component system LytT family response regulator